MDRISNLPENLIGVILEKLSVTDRVKTSALARKWRLRWTFLSSLNLDREFHASIARSRRGPPEEYVTIISSLVLQYRGYLKEFSLYMCPQPDLLSHKSYTHILSYIMRSSSIIRLCLRGLPYQLFQFPTFSSVHLTHLEITCLSLKASFLSEGFPNLTHLRMDRVMSTADYISHFVSVCPQLEEVQMVAIFFPHQHLEFSAPKLTCLSIGGEIGLSVSNAEKLESVSVSYWHSTVKDVSISTKMFNLIYSSTQLQHLSLCGEFCKLLGSCIVKPMLARFDRLKSLEFHDMSLSDSDEVICLLSFWSCSPNVRKLQLKMKDYRGAQEAEPLELWAMVEKYINNDLEHLVKIDLFGLSGTKVEMKIIEVLLHFCPVLEMMHINFFHDITGDAKLRFLKPLLNFYRLSSKAKIHFT